MSDPAGALRGSDPRQLGAFRLSGRLGESPEGVVYLGRDGSGRQVSVAMLSGGAADDPAARERFAAAVERGRGVVGPPRVLASNTSGPAVFWVAVPHSEGVGGAARFLAPVGAGQEEPESGPRVVPHWAQGRVPAAARWSWRGGGGRESAVASRDTNVWLLVALLAVLILFLVLLGLTYYWLRQFPTPEGVPFPQVESTEEGEDPASGQDSPATEESSDPEGGSDGGTPAIPTPLPPGEDGEWGEDPGDVL